MNVTIAEQIGIKVLWPSDNESQWKRALQQYYDLVPDRNKPLDIEMEKLDWRNVEAMSTEEFYIFLYEKYFVWKYTAKNRLATTRMHLKKYSTEGRMAELQQIKDQLFKADRNDAWLCLTIATRIRGLGPAGASGLLSILFPEQFGTVDQFVVKALCKIEDLLEREQIERMKPEMLSVDDAVVLTSVLRRQAKNLNAIFKTELWTPRKIDMILWAIER